MSEACRVILMVVTTIFVSSGRTVMAQNRARSSRPAIMLTGYWPPTNEMVRRFSTNRNQNPGGWIGGDWENRGYDVHSFFPEFPSNNTFHGVGDFEVDYQDTSADFWRIANALQPIAIITFSRGANGWEIERNAQNRIQWLSDRRAPTTPTPSPPDASIPGNTFRRSTLPAREIVAAIQSARIPVNPVICFRRDGGNFLSEFISYHGLWYQGLHYSPSDPAWCVAAGHIHVGGIVSVADATKAVEVTLRTLIEHVDRVVAGKCQASIGYGGMDVSFLKMCGSRLAAGGKADLEVDVGYAHAPVLLLLAPSGKPTAMFNRLVLKPPYASVLPFPTDNHGRLTIHGIAGGGGPLTVFAQFAYLDGQAPGGVGLTNALAIRFFQ